MNWKKVLLGLVLIIGLVFLFKTCKKDEIKTEQIKVINKQVEILDTKIKTNKEKIKNIKRTTKKEIEDEVNKKSINELADMFRADGYDCIIISK